jgi:hypothetical protein
MLNIGKYYVKAIYSIQVIFLKELTYPVLESTDAHMARRRQSLVYATNDTQKNAYLILIRNLSCSNKHTISILNYYNPGIRFLPVRIAQCPEYNSENGKNRIRNVILSPILACNKLKLILKVRIRPSVLS